MAYQTPTEFVSSQTAFKVKSTFCYHQQHTGAVLACIFVGVLKSDWIIIFMYTRCIVCFAMPREVWHTGSNGT